MNIAYLFSRTCFEICIRICFRLRVSGTENVPKPPFIATSNHASYLDPPLVGVACRKHTINFMTKKELFGTPLMRAWCRSVGCIEVARGGASTRSLKDAINRIRSGGVVAIFPEGTRSDNGEIGEAKRGIGFIVSKADVPVLPIYISGTSDALPKKGGIRLGARISVKIGRPISPEEFREGDDSGKDYARIAEYVMERIAAIRERTR